MALEIEATDVIKIILQFCKENGLVESMKAIQNECHVTLNTVENLKAFLADIHAGRWDVVLPQVATLKLPRRKLEDLYEQVVLELIELREVDAARALLRQTQVMSGLQLDDPDRFSRLESLCGRTFIDPRDLYRGTTREKRRSAIAQALTSEIASVPPSRLMVLIGQALKWQQQQGMLPTGAAFDLFRGSLASVHDEEEAPVRELDRVIRFGAKSHAECAAFTTDGLSLVSGSVDGFLEVWDPRTGKLRKDLSYQAEDKLMMHDTAVLAVATSSDGELIASGSQDGAIKVWRLSSGQCLRRFDSAHSQGVTSVAFSSDGSHVLSASYDGLVRIHGIKSGKMLKEFRGHTSYVNTAVYMPDGSSMVSASSDGTVRVWNIRSCDCISVIKPPQTNIISGAEVAVLCARPNAQAVDQLIICMRSSTAYSMTLQGQVTRSYSSKTGELTASTEFVACTPSPRGDYLYCLGEDGNLYCFDAAQQRLHGRMAVAEKGPVGLVHHPHQNLLVTFAQDGALKLWKAG